MSKRTKANQANAELSTGPKTPEGKQRSSQNALTHGLTARQALLPTEDQEAYRDHVASYADDHNPQGTIESQLVQTLADTAWRLNRIVVLEARLFSSDAPVESLATLSLHSQRLSREFQRTTAELKELQHTRQTAEAQYFRNLIDIMEFLENKGEPWDPTEDGFVFTEAQVDNAIQIRNRERLLEDVHNLAAA